MKPIELTQALTRTDADDRQGLNRIVHALGVHSRESVEEAVRLWAAGDAAMARKARYILGFMGDIAIGPLLDATAAHAPLQQAWRIKRMVKEQIQRQDDIVAELTRLLGDQTEIPYPIDAPVIEELPADERVCDTAYILMRTLLNPQAEPEQLDANLRFFRDLDFEDRDIEIQKYIADGRWTDFENEDWE